MTKTRIINEKGEVRFVSDAIAKDAKMLKSYGFRVEQPQRDKLEEAVLNNSFGNRKKQKQK